MAEVKNRATNDIEQTHKCEDINKPLLLSVVVPIYNCENYIESCVDSLMRQTLEKIEFIFIDDASSDASLNILRNTISKYPDRMPYIKIICHNDNRGISFSRLEGVSLATGKYIIHCDSDDVLEVDAYSLMVESALRMKADIIGCGYRMFGSLLSPKEMHEESGEIPALELMGRICGSAGKPLHGALWNKLISADLWSDVKIPEGLSYCEDVAALIQILNKNPKVYYIDKILYNYRIRENSLVQLKDSHMPEQCDILVPFLEKLSTDCSDEVKRAAHSKIISLLYRLLKSDKINIHEMSHRYDSYCEYVDLNHALNYLEKLHLKLSLGNHYVKARLMGIINDLGYNLIKLSRKIPKVGKLNGGNKKKLRITISGMTIPALVSLVLLMKFFYGDPLFAGMPNGDSQFYDNREYATPTPGEITIAASTPIPPSLPFTEQAFRTVSDCGFNLAFQYADPKDFDRIFESVKDIDLNIMLSNPEIRSSRCENFINEFDDEVPQFVGWKFADEPKYKDLHSLRECYEIIERKSPDKWLYINLVGGNYPEFSGKSPDYRSYLDTIERYFSPKIWSYDVYPITVKNNKTIVEYEPFYTDFELFSHMSKQTGRPFWAYCQSMSFKTNRIESPVATVPYLRFEAFSALAYGAQGIVYWTYGQRKDTSTEQYLSALVNLDGKKTPAWYAARQVNNEIKVLNDVFYHSRLIDCKHTGDVLYKDTRKLTGEFGPLKHMTSGNKGVLVSHLRTKGNDYLIIVNHDPFNKQTVRLSFKDNFNVEELSVVSSDDKYKLERYKRSGLVKKQLPAGGYLIFQWN